MKINLQSFDHTIWLEIQPETPEEFADLAKFALNAKQEPPTVYMNLNGESPELSIGLKKIAKQRTSLSPKR